MTIHWGGTSRCPSSMGEEKEELPIYSNDINKSQAVLFKSADRQQQRNNTKASNDEEGEADREAHRTLLLGD